jgi:hypothetical protein
MKALVVFESVYGNTRHIAEAVADGLRGSIPTELMRVGDAFDVDLSDVQLLLVGAPTHAWGLSRANTRESAARDATSHADRLLDSASPGTGVREWLHRLPRQRSCRGVAFDTRFDKPKLLTGCASRSIQRGLHAAGFPAFGEPHSFLVTGTAGPLAFGEIERAREWGEAMGRMIVGMSVEMALPARARL